MLAADDDKTATGTVIGITFGVIVLLVIACILSCMCRTSKQKIHDEEGFNQNKAGSGDDIHSSHDDISGSTKDSHDGGEDSYCHGYPSISSSVTTSTNEHSSENDRSSMTTHVISKRATCESAPESEEDDSETGPDDQNSYCAENTPELPIVTEIVSELPHVQQRLEAPPRRGLIELPPPSHSRHNCNRGEQHPHLRGISRQYSYRPARHKQALPHTRLHHPANPPIYVSGRNRIVGQLGIPTSQPTASYVYPPSPLLSIASSDPHFEEGLHGRAESIHPTLRGAMQPRAYLGRRLQHDPHPPHPLLSTESPFPIGSPIYSVSSSESNSSRDTGRGFIRQARGRSRRRSRASYADSTTATRGNSPGSAHL